jgi:hypothetical protein
LLYQLSYPGLNFQGNGKPLFFKCEVPQDGACLKVLNGGNMAGKIKSKEIQVQRPAQSLQAFQAKIASGEDLHAGLLKPLLITAGAAVLVALMGFGWVAWRGKAVENHESAIARLQLEVQGDGTTPVPPAELEKRMRERLPKLEALAAQAPSSCKATTQGLLNVWRIELDGKASSLPAPADSWSTLRIAQRQIDLGQGKEALATLEPLRKKAGPEESWSNLYWSTLLDARRLQGDRAEAWKDIAEYKSRFRDQGDSVALERLISGI